MTQGASAQVTDPNPAVLLPLFQPVCEQQQRGELHLRQEVRGKIQANGQGAQISQDPGSPLCARKLMVKWHLSSV